MEPFRAAPAAILENAGGTAHHAPSKKAYGEYFSFMVGTGWIGLLVGNNGTSVRALGVGVTIPDGMKEACCAKSWVEVGVAGSRTGCLDGDPKGEASIVNLWT